MLNNKKTLILLKQGSNYGSSIFKKSSGLFNSAQFLQKSLIKHLGIEVELEIAIDGNDIDRRIVKHKPKYCILEAIWVTPKKLEELTLLHPNVNFIVRIHSKVPFLSNEGIAIEWIKEYQKIKNVALSFNNKETSNDFKNIGIYNEYLPNLYKDVEVECSIFSKFFKIFSFWKNNKPSKIINIGCFGSIRPLKNQLLQAFAAIRFAELNNKILHFHINGSRMEQKGEVNLRNIRSLFKESKHKLIEHPWLPHAEFVEVIKNMDLGLQVSFTESFNIVSADFVISKVPIVVCEDINWISPLSVTKSDNSVNDIVRAMRKVYVNKEKVVKENLKYLDTYNQNSICTWKRFYGKSWGFGKIKSYI